MKIVVCYKNVPNTDSIRIQADCRLDFSEASWEIGQYDMNAIEAAMNIASAAEGSSVIAMTAAGAVVDNSKQKKAVLSRGPEKMVGIRDKRLENADAYAVAEALAAAIRQAGDVDLVLFGEGSGDIYAQQTGVLTGALLGWNTVNAVRTIEAEGNKIKAVRSAPDMTEVLEVELPAAVCVTGDINKPRIPTLKDILGAGKKPVSITELEELGLHAESRIQTVSVSAPEETARKRIVFENASDEDYAAVVQAIRNV